MSNKADMHKTTRRNIEYLLKDLTPGWNDDCPLKVNADAAEAKADELHDKLLKDATYLKLLKAAQVAKKELDAWKKARTAKVSKLRRRYQANGITPQLVKELNKLIEDER